MLLHSSRQPSVYLTGLKWSAFETEDGLTEYAGLPLFKGSRLYSELNNGMVNALSRMTKVFEYPLCDLVKRQENVLDIIVNSKLNKFGASLGILKRTPRSPSTVVFIQVSERTFQVHPMTMRTQATHMVDLLALVLEILGMPFASQNIDQK